MQLDRMAKLVMRVAELTAEGQIPWEEGTISDRYVAHIGSNRVFIDRHDSEVPYSDPDYTMGFLSATDEYIDSTSDVELKELIPGSFKLMQHLHNSARRKAKRVDRLVDDSLRDLEGI